MFSVSVSTSLRLVAAVAAAGALSLQPVASFAQTAPPAACASPVLDLANPAPGEMLLPGAYTIQGAALDPDAAQGSGIDQVSFFLGDRNAGGMALGTAQADKGPRMDDFSVTVTLPSTHIGEQQFVAYAHSTVTGKETQVSFPIVLGEDPSKASLNAATEVEFSTNTGGNTIACEAASTAPTTPAATVLSVPVAVPVPGAAQAAAGIAAAEAYAASGQAQDASNGGEGDYNNTNDNDNN